MSFTARLSPWLETSASELRTNRTLQLGLAAIVVLLCVEAGFRWNDHLELQIQQLEQIRSELHRLRTQTSDEAALRATLGKITAARRAADERLWRVSSDAVGQARLKDWMTGILKRAGVGNTRLNVSAAKVFAGKDEAAESTRPDQTPDVSDESALAERGAGNVGDLREIRVSLSMPFTPASLEQVLADVEGGDAFASVEALTVVQRERRVEMTVRVLVRLDRQAQRRATEPGMAGPAAAGTGATP